jgi:hypothetical protein
MLPLENLVNQFSGKSAQEIADLLNTDSVSWRPVPLADLNAFCDKMGILVFIKIVDGGLAFDSPLKPATLAALGLFDAKYQNLDLPDPAIRAKVVAVLNALSVANIPSSPITTDVITAIFAMGSTTQNVGRQVNGGELLTADQVQAALDRSALRTSWQAWRDKAELRIDQDPSATSLDALLSTPK